MYLRPIGTEFWSDWFSDAFSTNCNEIRLLYKVIGHIECGINAYSQTILKEELKAIKMEERIKS